MIVIIALIKLRGRRTQNNDKNVQTALTNNPDMDSLPDPREFDEIPRYFVTPTPVPLLMNTVIQQCELHQNHKRVPERHYYNQYQRNELPEPHCE